ncbi:MAG TPA: mechanosensitive ion channel family protein [Kofleriaceae bacterium]|nr:mechanosensitive ion channel family protein [Kofleriaceae bacterium]
MELWSTIGAELWYARTPFILLAYFAIRKLAQRAPRADRYHMRAAGPLLLAHLIAAFVAGVQRYYEYNPQIASVLALAFILLASVTIGITLVFRVLLPRVGFLLPRIVVDLVTMVCTVVVLIIVGKRAGFSVAGLITTSAVLTAVIGFSLQDTLGNVMGGLSVQLDKSVAVGDWITLGTGQPTGRVTEIRWRYTAIETRNWETVIIPNGVLVKSQVMILGRRTGEPEQLRRHLEFFVDFRTPPTDVISACEAALRADPLPEMATTPAPQVLFFGVRDSFAVYAVRYFLRDLSRDDGVDSAVRVRVWFALKRANISLSIPASTVFVTHETEERAQKKAIKDLAERLTALGTVDLFRGLSEATRESLAEQLVRMPFARGEAITREGEADDGLYMLVEGEAAVRIGTDAAEREVARLQPGQFFGEMSLMTGEARTATVIAATDAITYRVTKAAFQKVLEETPGLAEQIADVLVARRTALTAAQTERDPAGQARIENARKDLVGKIRGFFGLERPN